MIVAAPKANRLLAEEQEAILAYTEELRRCGRTVSYRIQTYEMLDLGVAAVSESTVYRVLHDAGLVPSRATEPSKKGTGFVQPNALHDH